MESLLPFVVFALVASITPGPTNVLVLACAPRHGLAAALPMVVGAAGGAASVLLLVGTGLARPLAAHPTVRLLMAAVGLAWLTVLAVQLWRGGAGGGG
ncbi:LysE family transporter, partial [Alloalcanivorax marinus]|uniref:LysE family transporter n=1 Tax=Alloalcanivorax marinus TaxID=1177169 RepID=UPI0021D1476C